MCDIKTDTIGLFLKDRFIRATVKFSSDVYPYQREMIVLNVTVIAFGEHERNDSEWWDCIDSIVLDHLADYPEDYFGDGCGG